MREAASGEDTIGLPGFMGESGGRLLNGENETEANSLKKLRSLGSGLAGIAANPGCAGGSVPGSGRGPGSGAAGEPGSLFSLEERS